MQTPDSARTRRRFLAGGAVAGLAGLAGCGALNTDDGGDGEPDEACPDDYEVRFDRPGADVSRLDSGLLPAPVLGSENASVTVAVFEDYACPHCRDFSLETFPDIKCNYVDPGDVRYEFHDFPIPVSRESERAANAARAVQDTVGNGAYWAYSKRLFESQDSLRPDTYADLAEEVDADPDIVRTAAVESQYTDTVQADRSAGEERGVTGTPSVFVDGGSPLSGYGYGTVSGAIEDAL